MSPILVLLPLLLSCVVVKGSPLSSSQVDPKGNGRIAGGLVTTIDKFPYQVGINFLGVLHCGGAIYRSNVVITAAHCIANFPPTVMSVFVGTTSRIQGGVRRGIRKFVYHENFDFQLGENDIGLVFLEGHLDFSDTIQPINMASIGEDIRPGTKAYISGWGSKDMDSNLSEVLQYAPVGIVDRETCQEAYKDETVINDSMICASGEAYGGTDPCINDDGGPLVVAGKVYGFVMYSAFCAHPEKPRIYTNVAHLRAWVDEKLLRET